MSREPPIDDPKHPVDWITSRLESYFHPTEASLGRRHFVDARVDIEDGGNSGLRARVRGDPAASVRVACRGPTLIFRCTCEVYRQLGDPCDHLWAALSEAESVGFVLYDLPARGPIRLVPDDRGDLLGPRGDESPAACRSPVERRAPARRIPPALAPLALAHETLVYLIRRPRVLESRALVVEILRVDAPPGVADAVLTPVGIREAIATGLRLAPDRKILPILEDAWTPVRMADSGPRDGRIALDVVVSDRGIRDEVLPLLAESGRLFYADLRVSPDWVRLSLDPGPEWELRLSVSESADGASWTVDGRLVRQGGELAVDAPRLLLAGGWLIEGERVARLRDHEGFSWISSLRLERPLRVPKERESMILDRYWHGRGRPPTEWPEALALTEVRVEPRPCLTVRRAPKDGREAPRLSAEVGFFYDRGFVPQAAPEPSVADLGTRRLFPRDLAGEARHRESLTALGLTAPPLALVREGRVPPLSLDLLPETLPNVVRALTAAGWHVEAEGKRYRPAKSLGVRVRSGIDWFDVEVDALFEDRSARLPDLLRAVESGSSYVVLDDGSFGVLPEAWLERYYFLLLTGRIHRGRLRFPSRQSALLEVLAAGGASLSWDERRAGAREAARSFEGLRPEEPAGDFAAELRPYQKEGLGWLRFLARLGLGGCLADDMGLGKTVQALALLESRRHEGLASGPSLVVAPRSLVFNWMSEARRFAPSLRVLDHSGPRRAKSAEGLRDADLVLTTYGTLVRDAALLASVEFDHAILDEAGAIKNPGTTFARAARALKAKHRLALTGTPVENHATDLWSIFEFLNPGMLGSRARFQELLGAAGRDAAVGSLGRTLRPLILRRTKREVASDLPEKVEQTLRCELDPTHRRQYDELRRHYRERILDGDAGDEGGESRFEVLAALLRLRQAACHPGLLDPARAEEPSAKVDLLLDRLTALSEEGNKALVFSQFTSLLDIVGRRLEAAGIRHERLDGSTRNRGERVDRFQGDPDCRVFLISLKAGGFGLNLTAAEYVFLLDPWWNPAVETQAMDRAHRIGQTRSVFAYRVVATDTVEERVLELQETKRRLADQLLAGQAGPLSGLRREDLELLFS